MRALVVEDERRLAQNVADGLRQCAGYAVDVAGDGESGLFMAENNEYDLVVLDLMLPKLAGPALLERYRQSGHEAPVLILTARDDKQSIIKLLNLGADDYLAKPFDLGELLARAKALVRRGKGRPQPVLSIGDLEINLAERPGDQFGRIALLFLEIMRGSANPRALPTYLRFHLPPHARVVYARFPTGNVRRVLSRSTLRCRVI